MRKGKSKKEQRMRKGMEKGKNGGKEVPRPHTGQHTDDIRKVDDGLQRTVTVRPHNTG